MIVQDLRYAVRMLWRNAGLVAVAVLTLALGIGANTALFSVFDALLFKSLAVEDPASLVLVTMRNSRGEPNRELSYPLFAEFQARNHAFAGLIASEGGVTRMPVRVSPSPEIDVIAVSMASRSFFDVLGVRPALGRVFAADDDAPGASPVAVLNDRYWKRRFAADPSVLGRTLVIQNVAFTVVGIAPPTFGGNVVGESPDIWVPTAMQPRLSSGLNFLETTSVDWLWVMGRLRPGVTHAQAQTDLQRVFDVVEREWQGTNQAKGLPSRATVLIAPGDKGFSELRERFERPLRILMIVVGLVLLVACVNVASLFIARSAARERETAIRVAVGATSRHLARQFLIESLVLSSIGGAAGLLIGFWGTDALLPLLGDRSGVTPLTLTVDARLLAFTAALTIGTGITFGLVPALRYARRRQHTLRQGSATRQRLAVGRTLIVFQVALSIVLVVGAGLFVRTLQKLRALDAGFDRQRVLMLRIDPHAPGYQPAERAVLNERLRAEISVIPGVQSVSQSGVGLLSGRSRTCCMTVPGYTPAPDERMAIRTNSVTLDYFATVGMALLAGRNFTANDSRANPPPVIVNDAFARRYFHGAPAVGQSFAFDNGKSMPIVGVVADAHYDGFREPSPPLAFFAAPPGAPLQSLEVRALVDSRAIAPDVRRAVGRVDPRLPIREMFTVEQLVDSALATERLMARISGFFGVLALVLACVGIYGLLAQFVTRRTNEIGIRMALGADRRRVAAFVLRELALLVIPGGIIGVVTALWTTRLAASLLFDVTPTDPITFTISVLSLIAVAFIAAGVPIYRASAITPLAALRHD